MTLDELTINRMEWVEANQKNKFEKGLESLLINMYPGKAHFIYELLQNSEDAKATTVRFFLNNKALGYDHNGTKLFTLEDIDSITGIGNSTKTDDPTQIGKFGVGFKAVYAYTNTPEIHLGPYDFRIKNLVVPITKGVQITSDESKTVFIFPFDSYKKTSELAIKEIGYALSSLYDHTLLFLKNIKKIEYKFKDGALLQLQTGNGESFYGKEKGLIEIEQFEQYYYRITSTNTLGEIQVSNWLKFEDSVTITT